MADRFRHPAWVTALGTAGGYVLLLVLAFVAVFVLPYLLFLAGSG